MNNTDEDNLPKELRGKKVKVFKVKEIKK